MTTQNSPDNQKPDFVNLDSGLLNQKLLEVSNLLESITDHDLPDLTVQNVPIRKVLSACHDLILNCSAVVEEKEDIFSDLKVAA